MAAMQSRMDEGTRENFEPRAPISLARVPLTTAREALAAVEVEDKEQVLQCAELFFPDGEMFPEDSPRLAADEARSFYIYTCDANCSTGDAGTAKLYSAMNDALRDRDRSKVAPYLGLVKLIQTSLSKIQRKESRVLWRGVSADLFELYKAKLGKKIVWWGFTSTTTDMAVIDGFLPPNGGTIFCVLSGHMFDVQRFSAFGAEKEMLLPAGTIMEVRSVYKRNGQTMVDLCVVGSALGFVFGEACAPPEASLASDLSRLKVAEAASSASPEIVPASSTPVDLPAFNFSLKRRCQGHRDVVYAVALSPDGTKLVSGSRDDTIIIWNALTGEAIKTLKGHSNSVFGVSWSPDSTKFSSASYDTTVKIWDAYTGELIKTLEDQSSGDINVAGVMDVAWSPNEGSKLVSGSSGGLVHVWNALTGELIMTLKDHSATVYSVFWSPDGTRLASGSQDKSVKVWDPLTGRLIVTLDGHSSYVRSVAWCSPDASRLVSASDDATLVVWDVGSGARLATMAGHTECVFCVAWMGAMAGGGDKIVSGSKDGSLIVWDISSSQSLQKLEGHSGAVRSVACGGGRIVSGSEDKTVMVWDARSGEKKA